MKLEKVKLQNITIKEVVNYCKSKWIGVKSNNVEVVTKQTLLDLEKRLIKAKKYKEVYFVGTCIVKMSNNNFDIITS